MVKKKVQIVNNGLSNTSVIISELEWFEMKVSSEIEIMFSRPLKQDRIPPPPPDLNEAHGPYAEFVRIHGLGINERLILMTLLAAEIRPSILLRFLQSSAEMPELGLLPGSLKNTFYPTIRTALFVIAGINLEGTMGGLDIFGPDHAFSKEGIVQQFRAPNRHGILETQLALSQDVFHLITTGVEIRPDFSIDFPAKRISTNMEWEDLILPYQTMRQIKEILIWLQHRDVLMEDWGMKRHLKPGYRCLFYGPPGTGKTLTASLLAKATGRDVYRIDLSQVVSKYIGETEKNLSRIFDLAEGKDWILFFDEADSLFGKRGKVSDARDRYANQEVSYLLQRLEDFNGLVILASNLKSNIDDAFSRRFQSMVYYPMPDPSQRRHLWERALPRVCTLESGLSLDQISKKYELAGGSILNVASYASLMALERGDTEIRKVDLIEGIKREYYKEGKVT